MNMAGQHTNLDRIGTCDAGKEKGEIEDLLGVLVSNFGH